MRQSLYLDQCLQLESVLDLTSMLGDLRVGGSQLRDCRQLLCFSRFSLSDFWRKECHLSEREEEES